MRIRRRGKRTLYVGLGIFVAVFVFSFLIQKFKGDGTADAASLAGFDPGYIISDYQMSNYNSMDEMAIQTFLSSKNPCSNSDYELYQSMITSYPSINWHWENEHFVCISEELFGDGETIGVGDTAAHIIWQAAQDYQINPQVLIVLLQKEQGLITDDFPNSRQYRSATGYGCPDTAPCSSQYYGFKNQVRKAAAMFRAVLDGGWTNFPLGENYIQYNPNAGCGGSVVNIRSLATSALYRYTPYQPNAGALAAGYGTAYCGAYGNRNFYLYFEDWFGGVTDTNVVWEVMKEKRVLTINRSTLVLDAGTNSALDEWAKEGENYYFVNKYMVYWGGERQQCLQRDVDRGTNKCILMARASEFSMLAVDWFDEPKKYEVVDSACAVSLRNKMVACNRRSYAMGTIVEMDGLINVDGEIYLVESGRDDGYAVMEKHMKESYDYQNTGEILMRLKENNYKYQIGTDRKVQLLTMTENLYIKISEKVTINGNNYYRTAHDVRKGIDYVIPEGALTDKIFNDFLYPRNMTIKRDSNSIDLATGQVCNSYKTGNTRRYLNKIEYEGVMFYQNEDEVGTQCVVDAENLREAEYNFNNSDAKNKFVSFLYPREMRIKKGGYMVNLENGATCDGYVESGSVRRFVTKQTINGTEFYRDEDSTSKASACAVPADVVSEI